MRAVELLGNLIQPSTYWRVWQKTRGLALTPGQIATPLRGRARGRVDRPYGGLARPGEPPGRHGKDGNEKGEGQK
jgi:hypothetical protein